MINLLVLGSALLTTSSMTIDVPVDELESWTALSYRRIPANAVAVSDGALHIVVNASSSPLVYPLRMPAEISGFTVTARWEGKLTLAPGSVQGDRDADDFVLKVGLVEAGDTTLTWMQRRFAAGWIRKLFALAPDGSGVGGIDFYSTTQQRSLLGSQRTHPLHDLLRESRIRWLEGPGRFELSQSFAVPKRTLGVWLSADGDNTDSRFDLYIEGIRLHTL